MKTTTIADGPFSFTARVVKATADKVEIVTDFAVNPCDEHTWVFVRNGSKLERVSVALADSTEDETHPKARPALARAVARMARAAVK